MRPILVIDEDSSAAPRPMPGRSGARYDAVIADACMSQTNGSVEIREAMRRRPAARLIAVSSAGDVASIHDAPDFSGMAARLTAEEANPEKR